MGYEVRMALKVIGAGFGRTGTASLQAALEELGFDKCYHMQELIKHPSHPKFWEAAVAGKPVDWPVIFRGYQATVDWPGCTFYSELMAVYPDAKVILSVRDPDRWYESTHNTIYQIPRSVLAGLLKLVLPHVRTMYRVVDMEVWHGTFDNRFEDRDHAIDIFNRHNETVKQSVSPEQLLIFDVQQGWEPLCEFLGVAVPPGKPFPHLNDQVLVQRVLRWGPLVVLTILFGLLALSVWLITTIVAVLS